MKKPTVSFGDIVLVPIPWADNKKSDFKIRPAVVISRENLFAAGQIIVLGISTKEVRSNREYSIDNWKSSGLAMPSKIWLTNPYATSVRYAKKIGELPSKELLFAYRKLLSYI